MPLIFAISINKIKLREVFHTYISLKWLLFIYIKIPESKKKEKQLIVRFLQMPNIFNSFNQRTTL